MAISLSGCDGKVENVPYLWNTPYHAKLKVEVDTPEGLKSGYSVIEVKWDKAGKGFNVRGEAVAVDLPNGETLFVLLRNESSVDWAAYLHENVKLGAAPNLAEFYDRIAADRAIWPVQRRRKTVIEDSDNYPYFVRFKNVEDPKTVEQVNPEDLASSFGSGYKLNSLSVQMVNDAVTVGIENRLKWLESKNLKFFDESRDPETGYLLPPENPTVANILTVGDFKRGMLQ